MEQFERNPKPAQKGEINYHWFDRFTFAHFAIGVAYGLMGFSFWFMLFLAILWELVENPLKGRLGFLFPHSTADTWQNAVSDTIAVVLGWSISQYWL